MAKMPYLPLYTGDWLKDPRLTMCQPASRGVWIDLLCAMHELDRCGELCGTAEELAALARCSTVQLLQALTDLQNKRAAEVIQRNGSWVIANRRMLREAVTRRKRQEAGSYGGSKAQANRQANPYQKLEDEIEIDSEGARKRVREFARGEGIGEGDADWFFYKCEGCGWMNAGKPIADWKQTVRAWWRGGFFPSQKQPRCNGTVRQPMLSFADRAKRKGEIQQQLNDQFRCAEKDSNGRAKWTPAEQEERNRLEKEMQTL